MLTVRLGVGVVFSCVTRTSGAGKPICDTMNSISVAVVCEGLVVGG